ncbi:hypothetical protein BH09PAT4_BH09PAT4_01620 [soil metagenome]
MSDFVPHVPGPSENLKPSLPVEAGLGHLAAARHAAKTAMLSAFVAAEVLPITNEGSRYGALAASELLTHNPLVGAAVLGGSTLLIEGAGALAASEILTTKTSNKLMNWMNRRLDGWVSEDTKISKPVEAGLTLTLGTPAVMAITQRQNPERTTEEARRYGLINATWLAGVCAVEGAMISEGVGNYTDPTKVGAALLAVGALASVPKWVKRAIRKQNMVGAAQTEYAKPRYDLTAEELEELEDGLVAKVAEAYPGEKGIVATWINSKSSFANFVRTHEAAYFEEVEEVSEDDEADTLFLALVDMRGEEGKVVHGATVTGLTYDPTEKKLALRSEMMTDETGLYTIDSLIGLGNFTAQEFKDYHAAKGINVANCIAVETNFRIGNKVEVFNGFGAADLAYLELFSLVEKTNDNISTAAVFASINKASISSFDRAGLDYEPLMGRTDLKTEESMLGKESLPVCMPYSAKNKEAFEALRAFGAEVPELFI